MTAPDIRYIVLSAMPELKGRKTADDIADFRQTVEKGRHPDGEEMKADMPRWKMSEADLADLFGWWLGGLRAVGSGLRRGQRHIELARRGINPAQAFTSAGWEHSGPTPKQKQASPVWL